VIKSLSKKPLTHKYKNKKDQHCVETRIKATFCDNFIFCSAVCLLLIINNDLVYLLAQTQSVFLKLNFFNSLSILFIILLASCVEAYWPTIDKYENRLVVDGGITDQPGPYTIRLSLSSSIDSAIYKPFVNCELVINDEEGTSETLNEVEPGVYMTNIDGIKGETGKSYQLTIHTPSDRVYRSGFEELLAGEKIDSVYGRIEYREVEEYDYNLQGYQFYVDTKLAEKDTNNYLWRLEATFHYQSDYTIRWIFDGELNWFHGPDSLFNCWKTYVVEDFFSMSTRSLSTPKIVAYPLHFVNTETRQLSVKYSLLVRQYTLNQNAFKFWDALREQNASSASLYAVQPYQIRGNIYNVDDPNEPVLGYFLVAGLDEKRIFVDRPKYPVEFNYSVCTLSDRDFEAYSEMYMADPVTYPIYAIETNGGRRAVPHKACTDCREKGGIIAKPDFWED